MWQSEKKTKNVIIRWCIGLFLLGSGLKLVLSGNIIASPFTLILGAIMITPEVAEWFTDRIDFFGKMLWQPPQDKQKVQPNYERVAALLKRDDIESAEKWLEEIIEKYPHEVKAHIEMVIIAVKYRHDRKLADIRFFKGLRKLTSQDERERLNKAYKAVITLLDDKEQFEANEKISLEKLKPVKKYYKRPKGV